MRFTQMTQTHVLSCVVKDGWEFARPTRTHRCESVAATSGCCKQYIMVVAMELEVYGDDDGSAASSNS